MSISESNIPSTEILSLFPNQGEWQEGDYFALPGNRIIELVRGHVEVPAMPSLLHQLLSRQIFLLLHEFVSNREIGIVMTAPTRVRIDGRHYREPDVLFVSTPNLNRRTEQYWEVIDLAVEIISPDDPDRDLIDKREDYAVAGVSEYWIVDPREDSVAVLHLSDGEYVEHPKDPIARSKLLPDLEINVFELFQAARTS